MIRGDVTLASPLSLYSIPVVWCTTFYPGSMKFMLIDKTIGYNNVQPRANLARASDHKNIPPKLAAKLQRMEGAHQASSITYLSVKIVANIAGLDNAFLNKMSLAYIAARILYNQIYIHQEKPSTSWIRYASEAQSTILCILISEWL
ncbi:hypothetical protein AN958_09599 [Leucoagaricus sp. SymC.cos]|nr:hypothetical protein AN958_09599 [Leucoagaricus sp. SymC.cos]